jgi:hypothetical protein
LQAVRQGSDTRTGADKSFRKVALKTTTNADEDVVKQECLYTVGGNENYYNY